MSMVKCLEAGPIAERNSPTTGTGLFLTARKPFSTIHFRFIRRWSNER